MRRFKVLERPLRVHRRAALQGLPAWRQTVCWRPTIRCMSPKSVKRFWDNDMHKSALSQPKRLRKD
ncbi:MAG: hypothetical protein EOR30_20880 [Mesorhizobium sp.]|nr:hypothetical protein EOA78_28100 [Mesorhizobium sp. M5C.F.Cr.IN.023.01.1.1]RWF85119.1 MAG: hypothetical protein EOQ36_24300 [Mesorhizobium sp.]RWF93960.1 MAG: hypothetical protein EOQ45_14615 [Mesorhizobium sp.]RWI40046.1 MAG: hypothetical protein EOR14_15515 [Mesorhizobium sp.]RWI42839.1 MAG: hypothetical protein EOR15_31190 [Mesorhizobium sp.]